MNQKTYAVVATLIAVIQMMAIPAAIAGPLKTPNAFARGTPAVAGEVNDNFAAVEVAVNDNDTRIVAVAAENAALLARLANLETVNAELVSANDEMGARLAQLESFLDDLRGVLSLQDDNQGNPAVVFSGVNVHVNNGLGATDSINGLGNLIVGYDEPSESIISVCSDGTFENREDCLAQGHVFAVVHKSGSHNLIVGPQHGYSQFGGLVAGSRNTVNGISSTVVGGLANIAAGARSTVSGGASNRATGPRGSVSGGQFNLASEIHSSVTGGQGNIAAGRFSSVTGGVGNEASNDASSVSGGSSNTASGVVASVSGGTLNIASGRSSSVAGGESNAAAGSDSSVSGGKERTAPEQDDWAAGNLLESN